MSGFTNITQDIPDRITGEVEDRYYVDIRPMYDDMGGSLLCWVGCVGIVGSKRSEYTFYTYTRSGAIRKAKRWVKLRMKKRKSEERIYL